MARHWKIRLMSTDIEELIKEEREMKQKNVVTNVSSHLWKSEKQIGTSLPKRLGLLVPNVDIQKITKILILINFPGITRV